MIKHKWDKYFLIDKILLVLLVFSTLFRQAIRHLLITVKLLIDRLDQEMFRGRNKLFRRIRIIILNFSHFEIISFESDSNLLICMKYVWLRPSCNWLTSQKRWQRDASTWLNFRHLSNDSLRSAKIMSTLSNTYLTYLSTEVLSYLLCAHNTYIVHLTFLPLKKLYQR